MCTQTTVHEPQNVSKMNVQIIGNNKSATKRTAWIRNNLLAPYAYIYVYFHILLHEQFNISF